MKAVDTKAEIRYYTDNGWIVDSSAHAIALYDETCFHDIKGVDKGCTSPACPHVSGLTFLVDLDAPMNPLKLAIYSILLLIPSFLVYARRDLA